MKNRRTWAACVALCLVSCVGSSVPRNPLKHPEPASVAPVKSKAAAPTKKKVKKSTPTRKRVRKKKRKVILGPF